MDRFTVIDIETENTGYDVMNDNKRIISIQMYDSAEGTIFYDGSDKNTIVAAKSTILSQIDQSYKFVGFNIRNFDAVFLNRFLGIEIPDELILEISEMPQMAKIRTRLGKKNPRLLDICKHLGIDCAHKKMMDDVSVKFRSLPDVIRIAKEAAEKLSKDRGWGYDFSYNMALDRIAGGMGILESFNDFVSKGGDTNSLFYRYAMGDVFTEHRLFEELRK
ncbi:MAG: hypothetical protein ACREBU_22035 [Nitrososphaera sp.]